MGMNMVVAYLKVHLDGEIQTPYILNSCGTVEATATSFSI